jgi:hypothetical protein
VASTVGLRAPWKPGQSGNPRGGSAKRGRKKLLREAMETILESTPPESLLRHVPDEIREMLPADVTFAEIIALRVTMVAATANKPETILAAAQLILNAQQKPNPHDPPGHKPKPPILPSTEARRRAVAEQLGLDIESETENIK